MSILGFRKSQSYFSSGFQKDKSFRSRFPRTVRQVRKATIWCDGRQRDPSYSLEEYKNFKYLVRENKL